MLNHLKDIKAFAFDCDGVMTDGRAQMTESGQALRTFNIKDGFAVQHAVKENYPMAIISGGNNIGIKYRFEALGVKDIFLAQAHKQAAFETFKKKHNLENKNILYMGDDMPDIPLLKVCGLSTCPADAAVDVKQHCSFISTIDGGKGCVREVIEMVLKAQERWFTSQLHQF